MRVRVANRGKNIAAGLTLPPFQSFKLLPEKSKKTKALVQGSSLKLMTAK
jgi:hypothetical protein